MSIARLIFLFLFLSATAKGDSNYILDDHHRRIYFTTADGRRILENQTITAKLDIEGKEWNNSIIRNNVFKNQKGYALHVRDVENLVIENNEFLGMRDNAIKLRSWQSWGTRNVLIRNNFFHDMPSTAIFSGEPNIETKIIHNLFVNVANDPHSTPNQHGIYLKGPDFLVDGNTIDNVRNANGISVRTAGIIRNNFIRRAAKGGINYYSDSTKKGSGNLVIENNLILFPGQFGIGFSKGDGTPIDQAAVHSNLIIGTRPGIFISSFLTIFFQASHNIFIPLPFCA